jgi:hypothetical protein
MSNLSFSLRVLIVAVTGAGVAVVAGAVAAGDAEDASFLGAIVALIAVSELFDFGVVPNARVSVSIGLMLAAGTFAGLAGVTVAAVAVGGFGYAFHRTAAHKAAFNMGVLLITGACYAGVIYALAGSPRPGDWLEMAGPAVAGAVCAFAVNSGLVSLAIAAEQRERVATVWTGRFAWLLPHYVLLGVVAVFLAAGYERWELGGMALVLAPLAMAWLAIRQYLTGSARRPASAA